MCPRFGFYDAICKSWKKSHFKFEILEIWVKFLIGNFSAFLEVWIFVLPFEILIEYQSQINRCFLVAIEKQNHFCAFCDCTANILMSKTLLTCILLTTVLRFRKYRNFKLKTFYGKKKKYQSFYSLKYWEVFVHANLELFLWIFSKD